MVEDTRKPRSTPVAMHVRRNVLRALAAAVWLIGAAALLIKGCELLRASVGRTPEWVPWAAACLGVVVGLLKGRLVFARFNRRNLARIERLQDPRLWQFFSPAFFGALALMIGTGIFLGRVAEASTALLPAVGALDLAIGTALVASLDSYRA